MRIFLRTVVCIVLLCSAIIGFAMRGQVIRDGFFVDNNWNNLDSGAVFISTTYPIDTTGYIVLSDSFGISFIDTSVLIAIMASDTDTVNLDRRIPSEITITSDDSIMFYVNEVDRPPIYLYNHSITLLQNGTIRRIILIGIADAAIVDIQAIDKTRLIGR